MIVAIVGSRTILDITVVPICIEKSGYEITKIISGGAIGIDSLAAYYAARQSIPFQLYNPDFNLHGSPTALFVRNDEMAKDCECAIVIWDEKSTGTQHMLSCLKRREKPYILYNRKCEIIDDHKG